MASVAEMVAVIGKEWGTKQAGIAERLGVSASTVSMAVSNDTRSGRLFSLLSAEYEKITRAQRMRGRDADRMREEIRGFLVYLPDEEISRLWRQLAAIARDDLADAIRELDAAADLGEAASELPAPSDGPDGRSDTA